jgi:Ni,Fe-hydrogenase III large subunit/NADH:ubiquinone oxidoreductase subunit C
MKNLRNGMKLALDQVPDLDGETFLQTMGDRTGQGWRISSYFGAMIAGHLRLFALLSSKSEGMLSVLSTVVRDGHFPSLTPATPQVHLFEREIAEQFGVCFNGHPWMKPVRFQDPLPGPFPPVRDRGTVGVMDYYQVAGEEVHEVAVGPVHAGIIEPGHFRFQCYGEQVFHLEISLGFQHRGIEAGLLGGPHIHTLARMETGAGDTTIGHTQAYAMIVEALTGTRVSARAEAVRGIALELERLANHAGDLGAIAGDVGYLPTASFCGRIRGDFLNMTALLCGSRFGRGLIAPGGVQFDLDPPLVQTLRQRLAAAREELAGAVELLWNTPSVMGRLENTGALAKEDARMLGLVGPAARASDINFDVRRDLPFGIYRLAQIPVVTAASGDVHARSLVRWLEAEKSMDFIEEQIRQLPGGSIDARGAEMAAEHLAVALTEGWRGEICHVAITDGSGRFARYKITDPSFHNWSGLAMALRGQQISDFPLCNKSFNLSYCGFDL